MQQFQLAAFRRLEQLKQITEPAINCADVEQQGVFNQFFYIHVLPPHPESLGDLTEASAVFRLPESVDHGSLKITDSDLSGLARPVVK